MCYNPIYSGCMYFIINDKFGIQICTTSFNGDTIYRYLSKLKIITKYKYSISKIDSVSNNTPHTRMVSGETGLIFFAPPWLFL